MEQPGNKKTSCHIHHQTCSNNIRDSSIGNPHNWHHGDPKGHKQCRHRRCCRGVIIIDIKEDQPIYQHTKGRKTEQVFTNHQPSQQADSQTCQQLNRHFPADPGRENQKDCSKQWSDKIKWPGNSIKNTNCCS